jgi:hypothetical protein
MGIGVTLRRVSDSRSSGLTSFFLSYAAPSKSQAAAWKLIESSACCCHGMGHEPQMSQDQLEKKTVCIVILSLYQDGEEGIGWEDVNFFFFERKM